MSERIRFHLDENVDPIIAQALRRDGIDVTTTADADLLSHDDRAHLAFARQENRILVTHDRDFLRIVSDGEPHAGIAYCQLGARSVGEIIRTLRLMYEILSSQEMESCVEYL